MIIKAVFGDKHLHARVIECVDIHLEDKTEFGKTFTEVIVHTEKSKEDSNPCILHLGKKERKDHLYIMKDGKTVDHMTFVRDRYPDVEADPIDFVICAFCQNFKLSDARNCPSLDPVDGLCTNFIKMCGAGFADYCEVDCKYCQDLSDYKKGRNIK